MLPRLLGLQGGHHRFKRYITSTLALILLLAISTLASFMAHAQTQSDSRVSRTTSGAPMFPHPGVFGGIPGRSFSLQSPATTPTPTPDVGLVLCVDTSP